MISVLNTLLCYQTRIFRNDIDPNLEALVLAVPGVSMSWCSSACSLKHMSLITTHHGTYNQIVTFEYMETQRISFGISSSSAVIVFILN